MPRRWLLVVAAIGTILTALCDRVIELADGRIERGKAIGAVANPEHTDVAVA
jgi:hypothetical protein